MEPVSCIATFAVGGFSPDAKFGAVVVEADGAAVVAAAVVTLDEFDDDD
ncbi:hypothetical protein AXFE_20810 [Acidithrix ferrooxidans]|uniref:Uncharacterized protein n=1 Tax=Acidithrix ferrooxidans TaxID=1280514 RepID=A0A0D8HGW2_9ACTN|nr:hypothetical protein [Acidithrix ferrooxidans]KJF17084.1 hypothetical protein AXFE_20810 [Acidithrix ferrooxidans]